MNTKIISTFLFFVLCISVLNGFIFKRKGFTQSTYIEAEKYFHQGECEKVIALLSDTTHSRKLARKRPKSYYMVGKCYHILGYNDHAFNYYLTGHEFYPKNKLLLVSLADLYYRVDLTSDAIDLYEKLLKLDKNNLDAILGLAKTYQKSGFFLKSNSFYKRYLESVPDASLDIYMQYANSYYYQMDYNNVLKVLQQAPSDIEYREDYWFLLAKIKRSVDDLPLAYEYIDKAIQCTEDNINIMLTKALWLYLDGDIAQAEELSKTILIFDEDNQLALFIMYLCLKEQGNEVQANQYLTEIHQQRKNTFVSNLSKVLANE